MGKPFKVFALQREEYNKTFEYLYTTESGEDIMKETLTYTGKKTIILGLNRTQLLNDNSIPEWKAKIIGEHEAEEGHTKNGTHKYLFNRNPITIL